jgi:hypothetical protein
VLVLGFLALYAALATLVDHIWLVAPLMFVIACIDFNTQLLIRRGIKRHFADSNYAPAPGDKDYEAINRRRSEAWRYVFGLPHLWKETGRALGCGTSAALAITGHFQGDRRLTAAAYIVLIATLMLNEIITVRWRLERRARLNDINKRWRT